MNNLYTYTDVKELEFKDFNYKDIDTNVNNNKFGFIIFYSPNCGSCKDCVYFWAEISNSFKNNFNIFAYNIDNFKTKNEKIREYLSFPSIPLIMTITKKGKLSKYKNKINYNNVFYYICKKIKS